MVTHIRLIRPPPPIEPGWYDVQYWQDGQRKGVTMYLERYGYQSRLLEFLSIHGARLISKTRAKSPTKDLKWTRSQ